MSKKAKAQAKLKRLSMKRARKDNQTKQYQAWAAQGTNQRSKRSKLASKRANALTTQKHAMTTCDNIGCRKCHRALSTLPGSCFYGSQFTRSHKTWATSKEKLTMMVERRNLHPTPKKTVETDDVAEV